MQLDFTPLKRSGVSQTEFAAILGVSRITVNRWVSGAPTTPHFFHVISELLRQLQTAVDAGLLPGELEGLTPNTANLDTRKKVIQDALDTIRGKQYGHPSVFEDGSTDTGIVHSNSEAP